MLDGWLFVAQAASKQSGSEWGVSILPPRFISVLSLSLSVPLSISLARVFVCNRANHFTLNP